MSKSHNISTKQPLWKQKLIHAREKWYLKHSLAAVDFGVPFPPVYSDKKTNELTRCVCAWLKFKEHYTNRINSQGQVRIEKVQLATGGSYRKANFTHGSTNRGTADITSIIYGKHVAIEIKCKATNDKIRLEQLKEKQRVEDAGGIYYIATDMQSFVDWYEKTFEENKSGLQLFENATISNS